MAPLSLAPPTAPVPKGVEFPSRNFRRPLLPCNGCVGVSARRGTVTSGGKDPPCGGFAQTRAGSCLHTGGPVTSEPLPTGWKARIREEMQLRDRP